MLACRLGWRTSVVAWLLVGCGWSAQVFAEGVRNADPSGMDCNGNGIPDDQDILGGFSLDWNGNGIPDECDGFLSASEVEPGTEHRSPAAPGAYPPLGAGASATAPMSTYLGTGEFFHSIVDLQIRGRGLDFVWARKYRSKVGPDTAMGKSWDHSYNIYIEWSGPDIILHDGNARHDVLSFDPMRTSWYGEGSFRELRQNVGGSFTLTFSDTGTWNFYPIDGSPTSGKINTIADRNNNTLACQYDISGRLNRVMDTLGRQIQIAYNVDGFVASVTDFAGRAVVYQYYPAFGDPNGTFGDLKSVRTPIVSGTPTGNNFPLGKTTTYTYSTGSADPRLNHNLLTITDPKGQAFLRNVYDTALNPLDVNYDRLIKQSWGVPGLDDIDVVYVPQVPGPSNNNAVMKAIVNDRNGNIEELFFDIENRGVIRREYTGRAPMANQPTSDFANRPVNPLRPTDPVFFETRWQFNSDSLAVGIRRHNQNEESFYYDSANPDPRSRGNLLYHGRFPGPLGGTPPSIQESFQYHPLTNFIVSHIDGRGHVTTHGYDLLGNKLNTQQRIPSAVEEWEYNAFGQVTAHVLPDNGSGHRRRDEFVYSSGYLQSEIVDAGGLALTTSYAYNTVGNVTSVTDPSGRNTLFSVNQLGQMVRQTSRIVSGTTRYQRDTYYDANDNVIRVDTQNRDENGVLQPNTHFSTLNDYEILNNVTRITQEVDTGVNVVTEYEYDRNRNRTLHRKGEAVSGGQPTNVVATSYDERDLTFQVIQAFGDPGQSTTQIDYDGNGNASTRTTGLEGTPHVQNTTFNGYDRAVSSVDAMGNETLSEHDANGNMVHETVYGELEDVPGVAGNVRLSEVTYTYDAMDRRIQEAVAFFDTQTQLPLGDGLIVTQTVHSDNSQILSQIDDNGNAVQTAYDTANRSGTVTDPEGNSVTYTHDANSNIVQIAQLEVSQLGSPPQTIATINTYDGLDRLLATQDGLGQTTTYAYDSRDNRVLRTDALGNQTRYEYDGLSRLVRTTRDTDGDGANPSEPEDVVTTQTWDDSSRQTAQTDDNGNATTYTYDGLDRRIVTQYADGTATQSGFDVHGNAVLLLDANGSQVQSFFDLNNRATSRTIMPGTGVSNDTTFEAYAYDGLSHVVRAQDDDSLVQRAYDSASHVTAETVNGLTVTAEFDGVGNQLVVTYPGGRTLTQSFDALGRIKTASDLSGLIVSNWYYGPGRVERRDLGNNTRGEYMYDSVNRMVGVTHRFDPGGLNVLFAGHTLTWDANYNKTSRTDLWDSSAQTFTYDRLSQLWTSSGGPAGPHDYSIDGARNRTNVVGAPPVGGPYTMNPTLAEPADFQMNQYTSTPAGQRTYDRNGNLIGIGEPPAEPGDCDGNGIVDLADYTGTPGFAHCMTGPDVPLPPGCDCANLDADTDVDERDFARFTEIFGTTTTGPPAAITIQYDYANRMVEDHNYTDGRRHLYSYDAVGRRIRKIMDADTLPEETRYSYDGWRVVEEQDGAGVTRATYVYGDSYPDGVVSIQRAGAKYFYHADDMYSIVAVTDATGAVVERYKYDDYGRPFIYDATGVPLAASAIGNTRLYSGHDYDAETGFYYCRTRYLDPIAGRYTTRHTVGIWSDVNNTGNGYTYVGNNPWSRLDPGGLGPALWWWRFTYWPAWWVHPWAWCPYVYGWYPYHWYWYPWGWWWCNYGWYPYYGWWWYPCHWWWWGSGWGWYQFPYWWWYSYHWWSYPYRWWWYPYGYWFNPWGWYWYSYWGWYGYGWWYPYGWWWYPYFWGGGWWGWSGWYYPYYSWWWYPYVWWGYPWGGWWYWGYGWYWWSGYPWWHWYGWWWYPWTWWGGCWWWDWWWPGWWGHWWWGGWWGGWWSWGWWWPGWWGGWWWWGWWWPAWWSHWWWGWWWWGWWGGGWWWGGWWWWGWWGWWRWWWWWYCWWW